MKPTTLVLAAAIAGAAVPVQAHSFLQDASPHADETLRMAPVKVALHFSEALESSFSAIAVTDSAGRDMAAGRTLVNGTLLELPLKKLVPGRYRVTWHAVSLDTHRTQGNYNFLVAP